MVLLATEEATEMVEEGADGLAELMLAVDEMECSLLLHFALATEAAARAETTMLRNLAQSEKHAGSVFAPRTP